MKAGDVLFTIYNLDPTISLENLLVENGESLYPEIYTENLVNELIKLQPSYESSNQISFETKLSPNPFSDYTVLEVTIPGGEEFYVTVHNMKGQELYNRKYVSYSNRAEIVIGSEIVTIPGLYYYKVVSALGELSGKFIRQ